MADGSISNGSFANSNGNGHDGNKEPTDHGNWQ
jgi:hypothetical protein